jgi:hypothetical protein
MIRLMTLGLGLARQAGGLHARSDVRLATGTAVGAVAAFLLLVVLPSAVTTFTPPPGLEVVWALGGPLTLVLAPVAAGVAGLTSLLALWRSGPLDITTRRLHVVVVVTVAGFAAFLVSGPGQAAIGWWQD